MNQACKGVKGWGALGPEVHMLYGAGDQTEPGCQLHIQSISRACEESSSMNTDLIYYI